MKVVLITIIAIASSFIFAPSANAENVVLRLGHTKSAAHGKLNVRFVSVVEDSRCPINAKCIWAGNAKIKIAVSKGRHKAKTFELNSTLDPKFVEFEGYRIEYQDLKPWPGERLVRHPVASATISVTRIRS